MLRFFIDTNILAQWLFYKKLKEKRTDKPIISPRYQRFKAAYEFIEQIKEKKGVEACISRLVVSELIHSLNLEAIAEKLYNEGLPFSSWRLHLQNISLDKTEADDIRNEVLKFLEDETDFTPKKRKPKIKVLDDSRDYYLVSELMLKCSILTQDAILLSTAINNSCEYFVTSDKRLRTDCSKDLIKTYLEDLQVISSENALTKTR